MGIFKQFFFSGADQGTGDFEFLERVIMPKCHMACL
jgi:hypothetical protein